MNFNLALAGVLLASNASAFQISRPSYHVLSRVQPLSAFIDVDENAQRDTYSMEEWARGCGVQMADGVELTSQDGVDYSVVAQYDIPGGSPVCFVPAQMILSSSAAGQEFGNRLTASESILEQLNAANRTPLFRLMVKILAEYEQGDQSNYFPWLNSLPRRYFNGVAMTDACFECLPPYVAWLAKTERGNFSKFLNALRLGYAPLSEETLANDELVKWAYNSALTRHNVVIAGEEKKISPMADMFNHGTNPNVAITYDGEGNCMVNALDNIQAGSPLTVTLGDPTNPSPMFATYGFLDDDCPAIFCKAMEHQDEMEELGFGYKDLLIGTDNGDIAPQVWDLFLYKLLANNQDPNTPAFFEACSSGNEAAKQEYHSQYFQYTLQALQEHVNYILGTIDELTYKAQSYDLNRHPRVPVIVAHNNLVRRTFEKVQAQLNAMG